LAEEKTVYTLCQGTGCHEHCVLTTHVVNGKIRRTEKSILPGPQGKRFAICHKGIVAGKIPYMEERILYPLKRVGERGEGKFERISWEQAMDEIGAKIMDVKEKYGSRSVVVNTFPCGYPNLFGGVGPLLQYRFIDTFGASQLGGEMVDSSEIMMPAMVFGDPLIWTRQNPLLLARSHYIINWAGNPIGWTRAAATSRSLMEAKENGAKIINIGPIFDSTAAKSDQWIPINPGTDAAMALAMANLLIEEKLYDEEFLNKYTVAPFLVRDDNGYFLRESDIAEDGDPEKYVIWNKVPRKAVGVEPHSFDFGRDYPDILGEVTINGIACKTAFVRLKEEVAKWTPESQEELTGVPAQVVKDLLHEYIAQKPSTIFMGVGLRYLNGVPAARALVLLPILSGNLALPNGRFWVDPMADGHPVNLNDLSIMYPNGLENANGAAVSLLEILDSFSDPSSQQYKAYINTMSNPLQNWPNRKMWTDEFFPNMELIVVFEIRMSDTALFADYILPETTIFEREEILCPHANCLIYNEPAIEPLGESKDAAFIYRELAKRLGLEKYFDYQTEDWLRMKLETDDPAVKGVEPPLTLERLRQEKAVPLNLPAEIYDMWEDMEFNTPSGRIEFYVEKLADVGAALPYHTPPQIHGPQRKEYPLQFFPGRHRFFMQGQFQEIPEIRTLAGKKSTVGLNPVDALARGINEGDWVEVFNDKGSIKVRAHLSEVFPPGMAHVWYGYPAKDYPTDPPTVLTTTLSGKDTVDVVSDKWMHVWLDQNSFLPPTAIFPGKMEGSEVLWDDVCEVRKFEENEVE